ncbi:CvpA family protein [Salinicoccus siamensis]|uniref:CvpA family protein n=1 Tax=Salinicoccus siamensis TaxID=381830 RepID=A0ABV5Z0Y6_9STAP
MTLILLILLIAGMVIGYRRGMVLQLLHLIGTLSAIIISAKNYEKLAARFDMVMPYPSTSDTLTNPLMPELANAEYAFYNMTAFFIIFIISKIIIQLIVSAFDYLQQISVFGIVGDIVGTLLGLIEMVYILAVFLTMIALVPLDFIETMVGESGLAQFLLDNTFILSEKFIEWLQSES